MISRLLKISVLNFVTKVMSALLVLVTQIVITKYYVLDELATYSKIISYISIATVATGAGLNISAIFHLRRNVLSENAVFNISYITFILLSVGLAGTLMLVGISGEAVIVIALFSLLNNMFYLHNARAQAVSNYGAFNLQNLLYALVNLVAIAAIYFSEGKLDVLYILMVQCLYLGALTAFYHFRRRNDPKEKVSGARRKVRGFFTYGARIFFANVLGILLYSGDIILLDIYLPDESLAIYLLAATAIKLLWMAIDSVGLVIYPELIREEGKESTFPAMLNKLFLIMSGVLAISTIIFVFAGKYIVEFIYGAAFADLYQLVLLLIIATQGVVFYKFLSRFFAAVEQWMPVYVSLITGIALNGMMIILLVPRYGTTGAAFASVVAYLATGLIIACWYFMMPRKYKIPAV